MNNVKKTIAVAKGDGIGPEIMDAVISVFRAADVPLEYEFIEMGKWVFDRGHATGMTDDARKTIEATGILFKGPMETPKGSGIKSINVTARKTWNTYANKRSFKSLKGVETVFSKSGIPIDIIIVRENIEDTYGGVEHQLTSDVAMLRRFITRPGSLQLARYAFEMARKEGRSRVTCGHKANIMKITDGLFLSSFYEVAKNYPDLIADDIIVDDLCMKLVTKPDSFDVIVLPNLQGDIVSDLCAGLIGGLGFAPSANIGDHICIFEAVHGTAPDIAGKNIANPTALLLSGVAMLHHLGLYDFALAIENALLVSLEEGNHTGDFGSGTIPSLSTKDFSDVIISNLGQDPKSPAKADSKIFTSGHVPTKPESSVWLSSQSSVTGSIVGVDFFIEADEDASHIANKISHISEGDIFSLSLISNRGTQIWPTGSIYTNLVNNFCLRFETNQLMPTEQSEILALYDRISQYYHVTSLEVLHAWNGVKAFSGA